MTLLNINKIGLFLSSCLILISPLHSAPFDKCDIDQLEDQLIEFGLDPSIRINNELLSEIQYKYGDEISNYLTEKHPLMKNRPLDMIDEETVEWVIDAIWNTENKRTRYMPILFPLNNNKVLKDYILTAFENLSLEKKKTKLVFKNKEDFLSFKEMARKELKNIILSHYPEYPDHIIYHDIENFRKYYLNQTGYQFTFKNIAHRNPILIIEGHGAAGVDGLTVGGVTLTSEQLIHNLNLLHMPNDATIKMNSCFSGCGDNKFNFTIKEIKYLFKNDLLSKVAETNNSFTHIFHKSLYENFHSFNGVVHGYLGLLFSTPENNVLKKDGSIMTLGNASKITGTDGSVLLKKEDVRISLSRSNLL